MAADRYYKKCEKCGAFLLITETDDYAPGCKEREEAYCPNCGNEVYSSMTSGFVRADVITEDEFNKKDK